jgi:hypothetical protein
MIERTAAVLRARHRISAAIEFHEKQNYDRTSQKKCPPEIKNVVTGDYPQNASRANNGHPT